MGIARWGLGDPEWPKTAVSFGGKYGIDDDTETPNTLTAGFNYGDRELVFEVRGNLTGGEGVRGRAAWLPRVREQDARDAEQAGAAPPAAPPAAPAPTSVGPASNPINVAVGNLFYGTEGWAAMSDQGFQAYKGESSELIMEERPERGDPAATRRLHMENFLSACPLAQREGTARSALQRLSQRVTLPPGQHQLSHRPQAHARSRTEIHGRFRSQQAADARCLPQALRSLTEPSSSGVPAYETYAGAPEITHRSIRSGIPKKRRIFLESCRLCVILCLTQNRPGVRRSPALCGAVIRT